MPTSSALLSTAVVPMEDHVPGERSSGEPERLTRRMAASEEAAFSEFHAAYFPRLFRYVLVLMRGDEPAARDVTQETLLRVVRHVRVFQEEETFWGWLARLARSAAADHGRRASRYRRLLELFGWQAATGQTVPASDGLEEAISSAFLQLSADDADLLTRKYQQAASVRELAAHFQVTEEAIESRLARARRTLRATVFHLLNHEGF